MDEPHWIRLNEVKTPRAVALAVSGLNTNATAVYEDLAGTLVEHSVAIYVLELSGHRIDPATGRAAPGELSKLADFDRWTQEVRDAARILSRRYPAFPRLGIGYSIGGAATVAAQVADGVYQGVVGLAPALAMTPVTRALCRLNYAVTKVFGLERWAWRPSAVRARYRANDVIAAAPLYTGEQAQRRFVGFRTEELKALRGRVTVVMRQGDPVVSAKAVRNFFDQHALNVEWRSVPDATGLNHEIFNRETLGSDYSIVVDAILGRLNRLADASFQK